MERRSSRRVAAETAQVKQAQRKEASMSAQGPRDNRHILEQAYGLPDAPKPELRPKRVEPRRYRPIAKPVKPQPMPVTEQPRLRLVGTEADTPARTAQPLKQRDPILEPGDPRWVLAVRTSELMQGTIVTPEARERLMKVGRILGLSPFDCSLVIAVVQDQARRGMRPSECPAAGETQLSMIPKPKITPWRDPFKNIDGWKLAAILGAIIVTELLVLNWIF